MATTFRHVSDDSRPENAALAPSTPGTLRRTLQELAIQLPPRLGRNRLLVSRRAHAEEDDLIRIETEIDIPQRHQAAHEQSRRHQEHQRHRNLRHDQRAAKGDAGGPAAGGPSTLEDAKWVEARSRTASARSRTARLWRTRSPPRTPGRVRRD